MHRVGSEGGGISGERMPAQRIFELNSSLKMSEVRLTNALCWSSILCGSVIISI